MELLLIIGICVLIAVVLGGNRQRAIGGGGGFGGGGFGGGRRELSLEDEQAEARRWIDRLGGQVLNLQGTDPASKQAMSDASERFNAAGAQIEQAKSAHQARLAKETALEGLYYVRAARTAMGMDPGPELPKDSARENAGRVTEDRRVAVEGEQYEASPDASDRTPYYYPGGRVAGRPVPMGWYSTPWWSMALTTGVWAVGSMMLFDAMFMGMPGIASAEAWEQGFDANGDSGDLGDSVDGGDGGDAGDGGDFGDGGGYDGGGDFGGGDFGGFGGDSFGGGDFGGFGDFGGDF